MAEKQKDTGLDAQAAAGALGQIFVRDITTAVVICGHCGREQAFAELPLYGGRMGIILRCRGCDEILVRSVETPREIMLEMRGLRTLLFPLDGRV